MSSPPHREAGERIAQKWSTVALELREAVRRFRESRLYVQVVLSAALVAVAGLAATFPAGPLARVHQSLVWTATHDYDFAARAGQARAWARSRGGWFSALTGVWSDGVEWVKTWVDLPPSAESEAGAFPSGLLAHPEMESGVRPAPRAVLPVEGAVLSAFGWPPPGGGEQFHEGLDLLASAGAPVVAVADGTVMSISVDPRRGKLVEIDHGSVVAVYAQVDSVRVRGGQKVHQGDVVAGVAPAAGAEKGLPAHLHFEIRTRTGRVPVDPAAYLGLGGSKL